MKNEGNPLRNKSVVTKIKASFTKKKVSYVLKNVVEKQEIQTKKKLFCELWLEASSKQLKKKFGGTNLWQMGQSWAQN